MEQYKYVAVTSFNNYVQVYVSDLSCREFAAVFSMKKIALSIVFLISALFAAHAQDLPAQYQNVQDVNASHTTEPWFTKIPDSQLNDIIAKILQYNATLNKMIATINRLKAEYAIAQSSRYPSVDLDATIATFGANAQLDRYYGVSTPVSYELDVWARLRAQRQAALADVAAAKEDKMTLAMTLVAEAAEAYYHGLYLCQQVRVHKEAVNLCREIKNLKQRQYDAGLIAKNDFLRSERALRELSAAQADMEAQRIIIEHSLKTMMGEYPIDNWLEGEFAVPVYLATVSVGLPSQLVENRPDIRAQQSKLEALGFRIASARRDLYPHIILTATGVKSSLDSQQQQLINSVFGSWAAFAHISVPLLDGGRRASGVKVEESRYQQALEEYKGMLFQAFKEVEDALAEGHKQAFIVEELKKYQGALQDIYMLSRARYTQGMDSALTVKERHLDMLRVSMERNKAEVKLVSRRIQLLRALGGEW
jgi:NodT family efflux transporter outer membrane factor (OMF) lipoprotein